VYPLNGATRNQPMFEPRLTPSSVLLLLLPLHFLEGSLPLRAGITPFARYNLMGAGGIRDIGTPDTISDQTGKSPALLRQGRPKVTTDKPTLQRRPSGHSWAHLRPCASVVSTQGPAACASEFPLAKIQTSPKVHTSLQSLLIFTPLKSEIARLTN
jgi:hypothetical protein